MKSKLSILLLFIILLSSCNTFSGTADVQVFFIDKGKTQYFFPSAEWFFEVKEMEFEGDWLFRSYALEGESESRTIFNFTVEYDKLKIGSRAVESLYLLSDDGSKIVIQGIELLYKDHEKDRYTSWLTSADFAEFMLNNKNPKILMIQNGLEYLLSTSTAVDNHLFYFQQVRPEYY